METQEKVQKISDLLESYGRRKSSTGIALCDALSDEEGARSELDPTSSGYSKNAFLAATVAKRIEAVPFEKGKTQAEYNEIMKRWLPNATCEFTKKSHRANVEGAAEALKDVLSRYPRMAGHLKVYASCNGLKEMNKQKFNKAEYIKELMSRDSYRNPILKLADDIIEKNIQLALDWYSDDAANFAKFWKVAKVSDVKKAVEQYGPSVTEEIRETVLKAYREHYLKTQATSAAKKIEMSVNSGVYIPKMNSHTYGCCVNREGVYLSDKSKDDYAPNYSDDIAHGFHPPGTDYGARSVMVHELGHALDGLLSLREDTRIESLWYKNRAKMKEVLSGYGGQNIAEMIAEAFCEYMLSDSPRDLAKQIGQRIDQLYEQEYGQKPTIS